MKVGHISRTDGNIVEIFRGDYMGIEAYRYTSEVNRDTDERARDYRLLHVSHTCYTLEQALEFACQPEVNY